MNTTEILWLILGAGVLCLGTATYLHRRKIPKKYKESTYSSKAAEQTPVPTNTLSKAVEQIRQIGLIEKDEFGAFYQPIMDQVYAYARAISGQSPEPFYFDALFKALRKRRATIFEFGSSEEDHSKRATWTYGLFAAISIRYVAALLQRYECTLKGQPVAGQLMTPSALIATQKTPHQEPKKVHQPNTLNLHLIDKVLPTKMIESMQHCGVYPSLVNAVTGHYFQPLNPFYRIIEDVERHLNGEPPMGEQTAFIQTLDVVLDSLSRNLFSKNTVHSLLFEGQSFLLIDRCMLWEIFRSYSVAEAAPLSKATFETALAKHLEIDSQLDAIIQYTVSVASADNAPVTLELRNMLALPYQKIPLYSPTKPIRIGREVINRNVLVGDRERETTADPSSQDDTTAPAVQPPSRESSQVKVTRTSREDPVVVSDLFRTT